MEKIELLNKIERRFEKTKSPNRETLLALHYIELDNQWIFINFDILKNENVELTHEERNKFQSIADNLYGRAQMLLSLTDDMYAKVVTPLHGELRYKHKDLEGLGIEVE